MVRDDHQAHHHRPLTSHLGFRVIDRVVEHMAHWPAAASRAATIGNRFHLFEINSCRSRFRLLPGTAVRKLAATGQQQLSFRSQSQRERYADCKVLEGAQAGAK